MMFSVPMVGLAALIAATQPAPPDPAPASGDPASTAVQLRAADTRMTVDVLIDGAGPFRFIVDSGATRTVISARLAALLHLPPAGDVDLDSVGGASRVPSVRIATLALGALPTRSIVAPVLDEDNLGGVGILGIDALAGHKVVIDLVAERMTIEPADTVRIPAAPNEIVVTARRRYSQLVLVDAAAGGETIHAIVDTGSAVSIGNGRLQTRLARRGPAEFRSNAITDVTGRPVPATYATLGDVRLGDWHLENVLVAFSDAHAFARFGLANKPAMLLGMDLLRAFTRVSIDFERRTVRLSRKGAPS